MFVRAKFVKKKPYAYLVVNRWKKGKVKQSVKKYLGRIYEFNIINEEILDTPCVDFSRYKKWCIQDIITNNFLKFGFKREKNNLFFEDFIIDLKEGKITKQKKSCVLKINDRYVHDSLLNDLLHFYYPESSEDTPGKKLAEKFSEAGIVISKEDFIQLYKKIYFLDN